MSVENIVLMKFKTFKIFGKTNIGELSNKSVEKLIKMIKKEKIKYVNNGNILVKLGGK